MSSTTSTSLPVMSVWRPSIRTTPEDRVPGADTGHPVHLDRHVHRPGQIGHHHDGPLQHPNEQ